MASTANLVALPPELQAIIFSFVPLPSDLKSICLSCKQLRDTATPFLYNTVILEYDAWDKEHIFFTFGNPGHAHVKKLLILDQFPEEPEEYGDAYMNSAIRAVLQVIPRDTLKVLQTLIDHEIEDETLPASARTRRESSTSGLDLAQIQLRW